MSDASTAQTVECPICEDEFDPTIAGGWCTNTECGEWQYTEGNDEADSGDDGFVSPAEMSKSADETDAEASPEADTLSEADDPVDDADESIQSPSDIVEMDEQEAEEDDVETADAEPEGEFDSEPEAVTEDEADSEPDGDAEAEVDSDTQTEDDSGGSETELSTVECTDCGAELDEDANFCVECGAEITQGDESDELGACPSCEADVEPEDSFCVNCGADLDAHREGDGDTADEAKEAEDAIDALADDEPVPGSLVLEVEGLEISVEDGEKVGREIRAALMDAGRPEEEAVRIHREHVRFVRESDSFYVLDLGDNPTALNGSSLTKGDREPVGPGDVLKLSGVATATVRAP